MIEFQGIRILHVEYVYLALFVPVVVYLGRKAFQKLNTLRRELRGNAEFSRQGPSLSSLSPARVEVVKYWGYALVILGLVGALVQPQVLYQEIEEERIGIEGVIALDVSYSMLAEDIVPSRLQEAKEVIREFIVQKRREDRLGLVAFAEASLILSYLTEDPENLLFFLEFLEPRYGTNIGRALKSALRVFERQDELASVQAAEARQRFVVLISDGEEGGTELPAAVQQAAQQNMRIYTIGIGSRKPVPIPVGTKESGIRRYLIDPNGNQVFTTFEEVTLREIARATSARFYRSFSGYELKQSMDEIIGRERKIKGFQVRQQYRDIYPLFLLGSLSLFLFLLALEKK